MNGPSPLISDCPVCASRRLRYAFSRGDQRAMRCADCSLLFLNPQPRHAPGGVVSTLMAEDAIQRFLATLARYLGKPNGDILICGAPDFRFATAAKSAGFRVFTDGVGDAVQAERFDLCVLLCALGSIQNPRALLAAAHRSLKPGGCLAIFAEPLGLNTPAFAASEMFRFDRRTLQTALFFENFGEVIVEPSQVAPGESASVFCRAQLAREQRVVSIIVPAFNEAATLGELMTALLAKELPSLKTEIVLVESSSTDGTRDIALRYVNHPRVQVILEDRPRGKGHAVRTGLQHATGDFVLIQDADLEYDLEDYDALLEPLVNGREAFVLGSRHSGSVWKMRQFTGQSSLSAVLNLGHWIFTTLVNVLFAQRLKDPFTMFKVFRRDCLHGLRFECNRFDFDYELLVKLIRKGYQPIELPVNYRSRSFKQGKKVSMVRDPLTWLRALIKLRMATIDPLAEIELGREAASGNFAASPKAAAKAQSEVCAA